MIELGFYISLMFSQFMDVKRKDFWEMFVHHIVTILLLTLSWTCNLTRIGTLVSALRKPVSGSSQTNPLMPPADDSTIVLSDLIAFSILSTR